MKDILVIDDEPDVADLLRINLRTRGQFTVSTAVDGAVGLQKAREQSPALIVLDLMLPRMSGFEVCRILKADAATEPIPVVFLTARAEIADRIRGLELGAADYVTKPFSPREVVLRIGSIANSSERIAVPSEQEWKVGDIAVNPTRHEVSVGGRAVRLTAVEFRLLTYLIQTRGRVQSRDQLLAKVWNYSSAMTTRTVDAHVVRLRKKLGRPGDIIETVRSYGYRVGNIDHR
ncbi:MAG TPA: response regulator transcription factor [Chthoniobacterales bacterium]|jgi:two-component system phosphate regulon response regulator PhoB|nr:response regulator transcription factor [Chthoniobacterales bacterium]